MSEATRQKISSAQKRRWSESQGLRAAVVSKLKASPSFNPSACEVDCA